METKDIIKRLGEVERRISDGEALMRRTTTSGRLGWLFLVIGLLFLIFTSGALQIIGVLVIGASAWRLYTAEKYKKEIESGLREYRGEKAELTAELATRD